MTLPTMVRMVMIRTLLAFASNCITRHWCHCIGLTVMSTVNANVNIISARLLLASRY